MVTKIIKYLQKEILFSKTLTFPVSISIIVQPSAHISDLQTYSGSGGLKSNSKIRCRLMKGQKHLHIVPFCVLRESLPSDDGDSKFKSMR